MLGLFRGKDLGVMVISLKNSGKCLIWICEYGKNVRYVKFINIIGEEENKVFFSIFLKGLIVVEICNRICS